MRTGNAEGGRPSVAYSHSSFFVLGRLDFKLQASRPASRLQTARFLSRFRYLTKTYLTQTQLKRQWTHGWGMCSYPRPPYRYCPWIELTTRLRASKKTVSDCDRSAVDTEFQVFDDSVVLLQVLLALMPSSKIFSLSPSGPKPGGGTAPFA